MRVSKWGNHLAVRLPRTLVEKLDLKEGDALEVVAANRERIAVTKLSKRPEFREQAKQFRFPLPEGYKFDRDKANKR